MIHMLLKKVRKQLFYILLPFSILIGTMYSCLGDYDLRNLNIKLTPEFVVPLAHGTFQLEDIIKKVYSDTLLKYNEEGLMHLYYSEDSVYVLSASEILSLPNDFNVDKQSLEVGYVPIPYESITQEFVFRDMLVNAFGLSGTLVDLLNGRYSEIPGYEKNFNSEFSLDQAEWTDLEYVTIHDGNMVVTLTNNYPVKISFKAKIYNTDEDVIANIEFSDIESGQTVSDTINISGKTIRQETKAKATYVKVFASDGKVLINTKDAVVLTIDFNHVLLEEGRGKFPAISAEDTAVFDVKLDSAYQFASIKTKKAVLRLEVESDLPVDGKVELQWPGIIQNGQAKTLSVPVKSNGGVISQQIDISESLIDLTDATPGLFNKLRMIYRFDLNGSTDNITVHHSDSVTLSIAIDELEFYYIEGKLEEQVITLESGMAEFPYDFWSDISGTIRFTDPKLTFFAKNTIGIPNRLNFFLVGTNAMGESEVLQPEPFTINTPTYPSTEVVHSILELNKNNSNLVNFMALPPTKSINYNASLHVNPNDLSTGDLLRIVPSDFLQFGYEFELPMQFKSADLSFTEKVSLDSLSFKDVDHAGFIIRYGNGIPLSIDLNFSFIDSISGIEKGALDVLKIEAAPTDENGKATGIETAEVEMNLNNAFIHKISGATQLVIKGNFTTPNEGQKNARLYLTNAIDLRILLRAKYNIGNN